MRDVISARMLAFMLGLLSLGQEILWFRVVGFRHESMPQAFSFTLSSYLLGIALGAWAGRFFCRQPTARLWKISAALLLASGLYDAVSPWLYADAHNLPAQSAVIAASAALKALLFPIVHHIGTLQAQKSGQAISRVYAFNIAGATCGPPLVGFLLLDLFTTQRCFALIAAGTLLCILLCFEQRLRATAMAVGLCGLCLTIAWQQPPSRLVRLLAAPGHIKKIVETRHGIVTIYAARHSDIVYGGNVYDGRTNLDPVVNSNGIHRVLVLPALQPEPKRILMIGLSIGTWLKLATSFPNVDSIDVVEINPGYVNAMQAYPAQASALHDPRVQLHIDDGRRWLKNHPDHRYDLVIMNTTYYWRAYSSNLLSEEFLYLVKRHLNPGAIITYNTTESRDVFFTATTVFDHAYLYENFVIAADFDWRERLQSPEARTTLASLTMDGKPLLGERQINRITHVRPRSFESISMRRPPEIITDRNLIPEYKYGRGFR